PAQPAAVAVLPVLRGGLWAAVLYRYPADLLRGYPHWLRILGAAAVAAAAAAVLRPLGGGAGCPGGLPGDFPHGRATGPHRGFLRHLPGEGRRHLGGGRGLHPPARGGGPPGAY